MDDDEELSEKDAEYEALAESLVTEALIGFEKLFSPAALEEVHSYLVDELVCTSYGRTRLRRLASQPFALASEEIVTDDAMLSEMKKKGQIA